MLLTMWSGWVGAVMLAWSLPIADVGKVGAQLVGCSVMILLREVVRARHRP